MPSECGQGPRTLLSWSMPKHQRTLQSPTNPPVDCCAPVMAHRSARGAGASWYAPARPAAGACAAQLRTRVEWGCSSGGCCGGRGLLPGRAHAAVRGSQGPRTAAPCARAPAGPHRLQWAWSGATEGGGGRRGRRPRFAPWARVLCQQAAFEAAAHRPPAPHWPPDAAEVSGRLPSALGPCGSASSPFTVRRGVTVDLLALSGPQRARQRCPLPRPGAHIAFEPLPAD